MNRRLRTFLKKATAIVLATSTMSQPVWAVSITGFDTAFATNFDGWNGTLPTGFAMTGSGATYRGTSASSTTGGVYAVANSGFGWRASSGANTINLTGTFTNSTGSLIEGVTLSYDAFQITAASSRTPGWTVTSSLGTVSDLNWAFNSNNSPASPAQPALELTGLAIDPGATFTFTFASDRGAGSGSSPLIGLNNISLTATGSGGGGGGSSNFYWVGDDTTLGGGGTWAGSGGTAWRTTDTDGTGEAWDSSKGATFGGASAGTVNVSGTVNADAGLSFATSGYTLSGGTLSLGGASAAANAIATDAATAIAIDSVITGSTGLTKSGDGTLTLSGANTYSGGTVVSGGTLVGTTASIQGAITNNAAVTFEQAGDGTSTGAISGSGSLTKSGAGNVTLSGANNYSGGTSVTAGTLTVGDGSTSGSILVAGSLEVAAAARLAFDRSDSISFTGPVAGSGTLAQVGSGTLTLSRSSAYGSEFTLRVEDGTVDLNRSGSTLVGILGAGNTVALAGGTLRLTSNGGDETKFEDAAIDVQASSTIEINRTGGAANHTTNGFSAPITVANDATLTFDYTGSIGSGLKGTTTYSAPVTLASDATFSVGNSAGGTAEVIFSDAVGDNGAGYGLTKTGSQQLTLSGTNTYSGGTTVSTGTLSVSSDANLGNSSGGITLGGGTLEMTSSFTLDAGRTITAAATTSTIAVTSGTVSFAGPFTGSGGLDKAGAGTLSVSNASSEYTGTFTISDGTLEVTGANAFASARLTQSGGSLIVAPAGGGDVVLPEISGDGGTVSIDSGANAVFSGSSNRSYNGQINGQGGLKKQGTGELTLNGNNGFTGATRIEGGRLKLGAGGSLSGTPEILVDDGAIFDLTSKNNGLALGNGQRLGGRGTVLGDLEFGSGSQLAFSSSGPLLVGSGTVSFAAGFGIGSIFGLDSSTPENTYTLLDETSGGSISFANLANVGPGNPFDLGGGKSAYFQQGSLQVVVVPEPDAFLLGGLGLALVGLVLGRRRTSSEAQAA